MQRIQPRDSVPFLTTRRRVLVVDDSNLSRRVMAAALGSAFEVVQATDGLEAIQLLKASPDFVCVVTDDQMPGCSGLDIVEFVRRTPALCTIPVILVTAGSASPTARQIAGHRAGASAFINKPIATGKLLNMVETIARTASRRFSKA